MIRYLVGIGLVFALILVGGCGYVGSENIYQLTDSEHELLYESDPLASYTFESTGEIGLYYGFQEIVADLEIDGTFIQDSSMMVPEMQFLVDVDARNEEGKRVLILMELRYIDSVYYMQVTDQTTSRQTPWAAMTLGDILAEGGIEFPLDLLSDDPEQLFNIIPEAAVDSLEDSLGDVGELGLSEYTNIYRRSDEGDLAVFEIKADGVEYLAGNLAIMLPLVEVLGQENPLAFSGTATEFVLQYILDLIIKEFDIEVRQYVSIPNRLQERSETTIDIAIDPAQLSFFASGSSDGFALDSLLYVEIELETDYDDFYSNDLEITIPEGAQVMSFDELRVEFSNLAEGNNE